MSRAIENWLFVGSMLFVLVIAGHPAAFMGDSSVDAVFDLTGLLISVAGLLLRVVSRDWKLAHGNDCLVVTGPYSVMRHPMYVGSFLAGLGLSIILGSIPFIVIYTICFIAVHARIAQREDAYMDARWPEEHKQYISSVPACLPSITGIFNLVIYYRRWLSSVSKAFIRERSAVCGVLAGACVSESVADLLESGWARVHHEVIVWGIVTFAILAMWLAINLVYREPIQVK